MLTMVLAVIATGGLLLQALWSGQWRPWLLMIGAVLYIGYALYLYGW
jgi:cation:H+ antiporter